VAVWPRPAAGQRRFDELQNRVRRSGQREQLRHALTLVHAARFGPDFRVGTPEQRIVAREIERDRGRRSRWSRRNTAAAESLCGQVQLLRLPRTETALQLLGIFRGIT